MNDLYQQTLILWWRVGKEHGAEDFRINPPELIDDSLAKKAAAFRKTPPDSWRWFQVSEDLIVERWDDSPSHTGPDTRIYYLLERGLSVIENIHLPPPDDKWKWYIHLSDFEFHRGLSCWLMKDLFCDILVENDDRSYHLYDLPDVARALDVGLITKADTRDILKRVDWTVDCLYSGKFPFEEIERGREACKKIGW